MLVSVSRLFSQDVDRETRVLLCATLNPRDKVNSQLWVVVVHIIENLAKLEYHFVVFYLECFAAVRVGQADRDYKALLVGLLKSWKLQYLHLIGPIS